MQRSRTTVEGTKPQCQPIDLRCSLRGPLLRREKNKLIERGSEENGRRERGGGKERKRGGRRKEMPSEKKERSERVSEREEECRLEERAPLEEENVKGERGGCARRNERTKRAA